MTTSSLGGKQYSDDKVIQLSILSGKLAGTQWVARRLPFCVGRAAPAALLLEEAGVWDRHFQIALRSPDGVVLSTSSEALTLINGQRIEEAILKSGDLVEAGAVQMRLASAPLGSGACVFARY